MDKIYIALVWYDGFGYGDEKIFAAYDRAKKYIIDICSNASNVNRGNIYCYRLNENGMFEQVGSCEVSKKSGTFITKRHYGVME